MSLGVFGSSSFGFGNSFTNIGTSDHNLGLGRFDIEGVGTLAFDSLELLIGVNLLDLVHWIDLADRHSLIWDLPLELHRLGAYFLPGEIITVQGVLEH